MSQSTGRALAIGTLLFMAFSIRTSLAQTTQPIPGCGDNPPNKQTAPIIQQQPDSINRKKPQYQLPPPQCGDTPNPAYAPSTPDTTNTPSARDSTRAQPDSSNPITTSPPETNIHHRLRHEKRAPHSQNQPEQATSSDLSQNHTLLPEETPTIRKNDLTSLVNTPFAGYTAFSGRFFPESDGHGGIKHYMDSRTGQVYVKLTQGSLKNDAASGDPNIARMRFQDTPTGWMVSCATLVRTAYRNFVDLFKEDFATSAAAAPGSSSRDLDSRMITIEPSTDGYLTINVSYPTEQDRNGKTLTKMDSSGVYLVTDPKNPRPHHINLGPLFSWYMDSAVYEQWVRMILTDTPPEPTPPTPPPDTTSHKTRSTPEPTVSPKPSRHFPSGPSIHAGVSGFYGESSDLTLHGYPFSANPNMSVQAGIGYTTPTIAGLPLAFRAEVQVTYVPSGIIATKDEIIPPVAGFSGRAHADVAQRFIPDASVSMVIPFNHSLALTVTGEVRWYDPTLTSSAYMVDDDKNPVRPYPVSSSREIKDAPHYGVNAGVENRLDGNKWPVTLRISAGVQQGQKPVTVFAGLVYYFRD